MLKKSSSSDVWRVSTRSAIIVAAFFCVALIVACQNLLAPEGSGARYSVKFYNLSDTNLQAIEVTIAPDSKNPQHWKFHEFSAKGGADLSDETLPLTMPTSANFEWSSPKGTRHRQAAKIPENIAGKKCTDGSVYFRYQSGQWDAVGFPSREEELAYHLKHHALMTPDDPPFKPTANATTEVADTQNAGSGTRPDLP